MFTTHAIYTSLLVEAEVTPHGIKVHFTELTLLAPRRDYMITSMRDTGVTSPCTGVEGKKPQKQQLANTKKSIKYGLWLEIWFTSAELYLILFLIFWTGSLLTWRSSKSGKIVPKGCSHPCWYRNGGSSGSDANPSTATGWFWLQQSICPQLQPQQLTCRKHGHCGSGQNPHSQISFVYQDRTCSSCSVSFAAISLRQLSFPTWNI